MNIHRDAFFTVFSSKKPDILTNKLDERPLQHHPIAPFRMRSYTSEPYGEPFSRKLYGHYKPQD